MKPTCRFWLLGNRVEILLFGRDTGDWRLQGSTPDEVEQNNPGILFRLREIFDEFPRFDFYAPRPLRFNAEIVHPSDLSDQWMDRFWRGSEADGVVLERPGQAFVIASADCPTLICRDGFNSLVLVAHAGRDCLFDRQKLLTGHPSRERESIVQNVIRQLNPREVSSWIGCGISRYSFFHPWDDPVHGIDNKKICRHFEECLLGDPRQGRLDLQAVIKKQLVALGVQPWSIGADHIDTCTDVDPYSQGQYRWHSARRDGLQAGRNLVVVLRYK